MKSKKLINSKVKNMKWLGLFFLLFLCILPVNGKKIYAAEEEADFQDTSGVSLPQAGTFAARGRISLYAVLSKADSAHWYGNQLTEGEREIYDGIVSYNGDMLSYSSGSAVIKGNTATVSVNTFSITPTYTEWIYNTEYNRSKIRAIHAYIRDCGKMYWLSTFAYKSSSGGKTDIVDADTNKVEQIRMSPVDYYTGVRGDINLTDSELNSAIAKVSTYKTDYEKVKAAHDYAAELITYGDNNYGRAHTITGGLLKKYSNTAVCECYSKLFRILCEENGIPCILITGGSARDLDGNVISSHMWNYVQLDGKWYLVDCTWDDKVTYTKYDYFLVGSQTVVTTAGTVASENHMPVGRFSTVPYTEFQVPELNTDSYGAICTVELPQNELMLEQDSTICLTASAKPETAVHGMELVYSTSDSGVAEVDSKGMITAKEEGEAVITVSSKLYSSIKAECKVTVRKHQYDQGTIMKGAACLEKGSIRYTCTNPGCSYSYVAEIPAKGHIAGEWEIIKEATCDEAGEKEQRCSVCGESLETQEIPAKGHTAGEWKTEENPTAVSKGMQECFCTECKEKIGTRELAALPAKVTLNATSLPLQVKKSTSVLKVVDSSLGDSVVSWRSSDTKILSVNAKTGKITAKKTGTAYVTVTMASGKTARCRIKVQKGTVKTTKLTPEKTALVLQKGKKETIKVIRTPLTASDKLTFKSSNKKIVTVSSKGVITAKKKGTAKITVKAASGKKIVLKVTVQ